MLRLKSRSVLCTPSSGLSRALDGLRVGDDVNGASNGGPTEVDDDDDGDDDDRDGRIATTRRIERAFASESQGHGWSSANGTNSQGETMTQGGSHGGPDFITPADAQFDAYAGYDGMGGGARGGGTGTFEARDRRARCRRRGINDRDLDWTSGCRRGRKSSGTRVSRWRIRSRVSRRESSGMGLEGREIGSRVGGGGEVGVAARRDVAAVRSKRVSAGPRATG